MIPDSDMRENPNSHHRQSKTNLRNGVNNNNDHKIVNKNITCCSNLPVSQATVVKVLPAFSSPTSEPSEGTTNSSPSSDSLVMPKKLLNPCLESMERKNLHKELQFNQKVGINVLNQKSELKKAMDKRRDDQKRKEMEKDKLIRRNSFEMKLEEQADKLKQLDNGGRAKITTDNEVNVNEDNQPEFLRVHRRVCATHITSMAVKNNANNNAPVVTAVCLTKGK